MGRKLIIKGADFSANAVDDVTLTWYVNVEDDNTWGPNPAKNTSAGWCYPTSTESNFIGQPINMVKLKPSAVGTITLYKIPALGSAGTLVATINATQEQVNVLTTYMLPSTFVINSGEHLVLCDSTDTSFFMYKIKSGASFIKRAQYSDHANVSGYDLAFGVGYYE